MRVLFTCGLGYLPQRSGGAQSSTDQLANALKRAGHEPAVLTALEPGNSLVWRSKLQRKLTGRTFSRDQGMGYPVFRAWDPTNTAEVVRRFKPDVAVVQNGSMVPIANSLQQEGVPVILYFRNVINITFCKIQNIKNIQLVLASRFWRFMTLFCFLNVYRFTSKCS